MSFREFKVRRNPKCPVCGDQPTITQLIDYEQFCGVRGQEAPRRAADDADGETTVEELKARLDRGEKVFILDVRNPEEYQICRIPGSTLLPLPELPQRFGELDRSREMVVHCKSGMRSAEGDRSSCASRASRSSRTSRAASWPGRSEIDPTHAEVLTTEGVEPWPGRRSTGCITARAE